MSTFTKTMEKGLHNFLEFLPCSWYRGAAFYVTCTIKKENYGHPYGMYEYDIQVRFKMPSLANNLPVFKYVRHLSKRTLGSVLLSIKRVII